MVVPTNGHHNEANARRLRVLLLAVMVLSLGVLLPQTVSGARAPTPIGQVRYILHGLGIRPPHQRAAKGKVKQSLYSQYGLVTKVRQKASVSFRDGTVLYINQTTDAVLRSPALTELRSGEVEQQVVPGTTHTIQTAAATAAAVGTIFDVRVTGSDTTITVIEGAVLVTTPQGTVVVKTGEQVRVSKGQTPGIPVPVVTKTVTGWTAQLPAPATPLGLNVALDANGGTIYRWTSQRSDAGHAFDAVNANDGRLDRGWQSAEGQITDQSLWIRFQGGRQYNIAGLVLDCAATGGQDPANAARDFVVLTGSDAASSLHGASAPHNRSLATTIYSGTCSQSNVLQRFVLPTPVPADMLEVTFKNNHGGSAGIAVAELEVISTDEPMVLGTATPTPTPSPTPTPTPTSTPVPTATQVMGCVGPEFLILDTFNGGSADNGALPPSFDTRTVGDPNARYCLITLATYHWNNGRGATPGTLGLQDATGANVPPGPFPATGSSGQGGAANVDWIANAPTAPPVILRGRYSVIDSDPATWSQNITTNGLGFARVWVTKYVGP